MDKRTLIFVLALSLTLFFVNLFFEQRNTESTREMQTQHLAKKTEALQKMSEGIKARTAQVSSLPVVELYADEAGKKPLAKAIQVKDAVLAAAWTADLPSKVYVQLKGDEKKTELTLAKTSAKLSEPVIYRQSSSKLSAGDLPEFGKYDLQLVLLNNDPVKVYLGEYADGHLEIPAKKAAALQKELTPEISPQPLSVDNAIALLKTADGYLPVGVYNKENREITALDAMPALAPFVAKPEKKAFTASTSNQKSGEAFYVLETPYQQLVFSNYGGALVEINLPFNSKKDEESVVKEIEFDRDMVQKHPYNARFPAHAYFTSEKSADGSWTEHKEGMLGGYYPLLRRDLIEKDKRKSIRIQPRFYALNIVSEYPETAELVYEVKSFDSEHITFEAVQAHRRITKTFSVASEAQAPYAIDLAIQIEGDSRGLWLTSGIPEVEWISGAPAPALKYRMTRNQKVEVENIDLPKDAVTVTSTSLDWICNSNGFLGLILDPLGEKESGYRAQRISGTVVPSRLVEIDREHNRYDAEAMPGYMMQLPLKSSGGEMHFRVFAGPFAESVLKKVDEVYSNPATGYNPDYMACQSFHGWFSFISEPFAKFLFILMKFFYSMTGSWAFSIVLLTVALRVMLYPLNAWSTKSMVRMQQIAPEVTAIQEKYKKDPKKAQLEIMNLYRERGVNPVSGCFPLLIQMPFLIGMFDLLKSTFELRGASFIPGWIDNLTAPDVLFTWNYPLPLIGNEFHLLPILLGIVMFLQQRFMSTAPKDPALMTDQQRQQRFMGNIMAIVFTVMFYNFPSGLNIYWLSSMLLGILQQWWTAKKLASNVPQPSVVVLPKGKK